MTQTAGSGPVSPELEIPEEARFRLLVEAVTDYAIYMLDPTGHVASWNAGAERAKGYSRAEIIGHHFSRFYTDEDKATGLPQRALSIAQAEGRFEGEGWRMRKDGSRMWAHVIIDPIVSPEGCLLGFAKITRDLTERVEAQKKLEQAREALFQAQKMDALGKLTGGIAHDFNNLLMAVLSSLELMRKRLPDDPKLLQLLGNAVQGAERGAALTQRMLSFARRQDLDAAPVDVRLLVTDIKGLMERTLGPAVNIVVQAEGDVRPAIADANQLELAILNLAVNARDAMPGGGAITIEIRERTIEGGDQGLAPGQYVCVSLSDTGEGMDATTLARATEPFFTTKGVGRGTGLGLSMVHGFAEQLGGGLRLRSEKNVGSTAELWLPVADAPAEATAQVEAASAVAAGPRQLTVLAVDDDALVLMNTTEMLREFGHTVIEAMNGKEALALLAEHPGIDVVVTDYAMPLMTGAQLVSEMAALWPGVPVVLATGYAELPTGETIKAVRLPKPFNEPDLARALAEATRTLSRPQ